MYIIRLLFQHRSRSVITFFFICVYRCVRVIHTFPWNPNQVQKMVPCVKGDNLSARGAIVFPLLICKICTSPACTTQMTTTFTLAILWIQVCVLCVCSRYREVCDVSYIAAQSEEEPKRLVPTPSSFSSIYLGTYCSLYFLLHALAWPF